VFERVLVRAFDKAVRRKALAFAADAADDLAWLKYRAHVLLPRFPHVWRSEKPIFSRIMRIFLLERTR
jgi:hypothetical protein